MKKNWKRIYVLIQWTNHDNDEKMVKRKRKMHSTGYIVFQSQNQVMCADECVVRYVAFETKLSVKTSYGWGTSTKNFLWCHIMREIWTKTFNDE